MTKPLTEIETLRLQYWRQLVDLGKERKSNLHFERLPTRHFYDFSIARDVSLKRAKLIATIDTQRNRIAVFFETGETGIKAIFQHIYEQRESIEKELGFNLEWEQLPNRKACKAILDKYVNDLSNKEEWPECHEWMLEHLEKMDRVFRPRVEKLNFGY